MKLNTVQRGLLLSLVVVATAGFVGLSAALAGPSASSVVKVDMQRFAGQWFELAHLPSRFQSNCVSDTTASYHPLPDGSVEVVNRCREGLEKWNVAEGRAFLAKGDTSGARLKVTFLPDWLQWISLGRGDYWVVMLDPGYRYAVVSEPSKKNLWILSRTPAMDPALYKSIVESLRTAGYSVDKLIRTPHQPPPAAGAWLRLMV